MASIWRISEFTDSVSDVSFRGKAHDDIQSAHDLLRWISLFVPNESQENIVNALMSLRNRSVAELGQKMHRQWRNPAASVAIAHQFRFS